MPALPAPPGGAAEGGGSGVCELDRAGLAALVGLQLVGDALVLDEAVHAGLLDRADMDEGVVAAVLGRDEAKAFLALKNLTLPMGMGVFLLAGGPEWRARCAGEAERRKKEPQSAEDRLVRPKRAFKIGAERGLIAGREAAQRGYSSAGFDCSWT